MPNTIQFKRGNEVAIPILKPGEPGFCLDTKNLYVGDGVNNIRYVKENEIQRATTEEAISGINNTKLMTPKTVKEAIKANGGTGSGVINNVFTTSISQGSFTASSAVNVFNIPNMDTSKEVEIIYRNLQLVEGQEYEINKTTGQVELGFNLEVGESIYFRITSTGYNYNDLSGTPDVGDTKNLQTSSKEVVGAINELRQTTIQLESNKIANSSIVNDLTTASGVSDKVLDARQGKVLNDKIGQLETTRGYLTSKIIPNGQMGTRRYNGIYTYWGDADRPGSLPYATIISTTGQDQTTVGEIAIGCTGTGLAYRGGKHDANPTWKKIITETELNDRGILTTKIISNTNLDSLLDNGKYMGENLSGSPHTLTGVWWNVEVHRGPSNYCEQIITYMVGGDFKQGTKFSRVMKAGTWQPWTYIGVSVVKNITFVNGWVNFDTTSRYCINGNLVTANIRIKSGTATNGTLICTLPRTNVGPIYFNGYRAGLTTLNGVFRLDTNGQLTVYGDGLNNIDVMLNLSYVTQLTETSYLDISNDLEELMTPDGIFTNNEMSGKSAQQVYDEWVIESTKPVADEIPFNEKITHMSLVNMEASTEVYELVLSLQEQLALALNRIQTLESK